jgi:hypothetical protein
VTQSLLNEGTKTGRLRICRSSDKLTLAADSICQTSVWGAKEFFLRPRLHLQREGLRFRPEVERVH